MFRGKAGPHAKAAMVNWTLARLSLFGKTMGSVDSARDEKLTEAGT